MPVYPPTAGNRARVADLIRRFEHAGIESSLVYVDLIPGDTSECRAVMGPSRFVHLRYKGTDLPFRMRRTARRLARMLIGLVPPLRRLALRAPSRGKNAPLESFFDSEVALAIERFVEEQRPEFVVFVYGIWGPYARRLSGKTRLIVDAQDRLADRYLRVPDSGGLFSLTLEDERRSLSAFDVVLAIQPEEGNTYASYASNVVTVCHAIAAEPVAQASLAASQSVLFLGGRNAVNSATLRRIQRIWPQVTARCPAARLLVAGEVAQEASPGDSVVALGRIDRLHEYYSMGRVLLNPVPYGTGLKVKNIEALAHGVPVVTTPAGAEGLPVEASGMLVADSDEAMVDAVASVLQDTELTLRLHRRATSFVRQWNEEQDRAFTAMLNAAAARAR